MKASSVAVHVSIFVGAAIVSANVPLCAEPSSPPAATPPPHQGTPPVASATDLSPAEARSRRLQDYYEDLAEAPDAATAERIVREIEAVWMMSGSATANLILERAIRAVEAQRIDLGLKLLDTVTELYPDWAEGFNRRAYVHVMRRDLNRAVGDLRRVLALDPGNFRALEGLAQILRDMGQAKAALSVVRELLTRHPHSPGAKDMLKELEREVEGQGI